MTVERDDFLSILTFAALEFTALTLALAFVVALLCLAVMELFLRPLVTRLIYGFWRGRKRVHPGFFSYWLPYRQFCGQVLSLGLAYCQRNQRRLQATLQKTLEANTSSDGFVKTLRSNDPEAENTSVENIALEQSHDIAEEIKSRELAYGVDDNSDLDKSEELSNIRAIAEAMRMDDVEVLEHQIEDLREESDHFEHNVNGLQRTLGTVTNYVNYLICIGISGFVVYLIAQAPRAADNALGPNVFELGANETYVLYAVAIVSATIAPLIVQILERRLLQR